MNDEMFDRMYQQGRAAMNRDIGGASDRIASSFGKTLQTLNRIQWSAPWKQQQKRLTRAR